MVVQDPGFTQSYNRYSYAWNNPLKFTDPTGNTVTMQDLQREMDESSREWFAYARRQYTNMPYRSDWKSERQVIPGYEIQQFTYSTDMYNQIGDDEWQYSYSYVNKTQNELVFVGFGQDAAQGGGNGWITPLELGLGVGELARQGKVYQIFGTSAQRVEKALSKGQYVSSKSISSTAKLARNLGRGISGAGVVISLYQFGASDQTGADYAKLAGTALITGTAFIPIVGPFISIGLGVADSFGAFDGIYNSFDP